MMRPTRGRHRHVVQQRGQPHHGHVGGFGLGDADGEPRHPAHMVEIVGRIARRIERGGFVLIEPRIAGLFGADFGHYPIRSYLQKQCRGRKVPAPTVAYHIDCYAVDRSGGFLTAEPAVARAVRYGKRPHNYLHCCHF